VYGLRNGQYYYDKEPCIVHNAGWVSPAGKIMGTGDLRAKDLRRIADQIPEGELFIAITEGHLFEAQYGPRGDAKIPDIHNIGIDKIVECAWIIIARNKFYIASFFGYTKGKEIRDGIRFQVISRARAERMIRAADAVNS
jgi:hypothetical protein